MSEKNPKIMHSPLSKCWYLVTAYKALKSGGFEATKKIDITDEMNRILNSNACANRSESEIKAAFALYDNREKVVDWLNVIEGLNVSGELKGSHDEISDAVTAALAILQAEKELSK